MPVVKSNLRAALYALLAFALYATHDVVVKFLGAIYSPFQIIFYSVLLGFPLITVMLMSDRTDGNLLPRHPWWTALRTVMAVITGISAFFAFTLLPLAQTYAILFAMPLLITLLAIPILGEKVGLRRGAAVLVGLAGVMIVLRPGDAALGLGHAAGLLAAVTGAVASIVVRKIGQDERSAVLMLYPMVANFVVMVCVLPFVYIPMPVSHLGLLGVMAALGFIASALVIAAYRSGEAVIVAPMQYSQIIWAAIYGALIFGEASDMYTVIGTSVIIASGIYIVLREDKATVSENKPVLSNRSRPETGIMPRISFLLQRSERRDAERDTL